MTCVWSPGPPVAEQTHCTVLRLFVTTGRSVLYFTRMLIADTAVTSHCGASHTHSGVLCLEFSNWFHFLSLYVPKVVVFLAAMVQSTSSHTVEGSARQK